MSAPALGQPAERKFVRKEHEHLAVLEARLEHLRTGHGHPERSGDPAYPAGEANAIAWALALIRGLEEPIEIRVERLEKQLRVLGSRLGNLERDLGEDDE